jgi:dienelactone hydrolase
VGIGALPQYYRDNLPHLTDGDPRPHVPTLADAIAKIASRTDADSDRLGLVGYSLGAGTSMTYIASNLPGKVKVLVDFFGPIEGNSIIASGVGKFPPTLIFHNTKDDVVKFVPNSEALDSMLPKSVEHLLISLR